MPIKFLTFEQFVESQLITDETKYATPADAVKAAAFAAWNYQRELARLMADEIDGMSQALGHLPLPMLVAVSTWKGLPIDQTVLDELTAARERILGAMAQDMAGDSPELPDAAAGATATETRPTDASESATATSATTETATDTRAPCTYTTSATTPEGGNADRKGT